LINGRGHLSNLSEALEIYLNLDDRDIIGKSFINLADAFISAGRFHEAIAIARRGLVYLEGDVTADRVRLLAALAHACAPAEGYEPAQEALREAFHIASQLSNPELEARLLGVRSTIDIQFLRVQEATAAGLQSEQSGETEASPWRRALQLRILVQTFLYLGYPGEALRIVEQLEPLARKMGQAYSVALCLRTRAWIEFGNAPDLTKLETRSSWCRNLTHGLCGFPSGKFSLKYSSVTSSFSKATWRMLCYTTKPHAATNREAISKDIALERCFAIWLTPAIAMAHCQSSMRNVLGCLLQASGIPEVRG
jgi:tetratricopeptide (TPR) repeat protein